MGNKKNYVPINGANVVQYICQTSSYVAIMMHSRIAPSRVALVLGVLLSIWGVQSSAASYTCSWNTSTSADWTTSSDWLNCNSAFPDNTSTDTFDAIISMAGTYTVSLTAPVTIGSLTLNNRYATLSNSSVLTTTSGIDLQAGTLAGGTYAISGSATTAVSLSSGGANATLNNVTLTLI